MLVLSSSTLAFTVTVGDDDPTPQTVVVQNGGSGTLLWQASVPTDVTWLTLSPLEGTAPTTVTVTPIISGLASAVYTVAVTISDIESLNNAAINRLQTSANLTVMLTIEASRTYLPVILREE